MRKALFSIIATAALISLPSVVQAQEQVAYWGKEDAYLFRQAKYMYE